MFSRNFILVIGVLHIIHHAAYSLPELIKIGAIFDTDNPLLEIAFRNAIQDVNLDNTILPKTHLQGHVEHVYSDNSLEISKRVCKLVNAGVVAIFGPASPYTASHTQSICDALEIAHMETRFDNRLRREDYQINVHPHHTSLSKAYLDMLLTWNWKSFTVICEDDDSYLRLENVLLHYSPITKSNVILRLLPQEQNYRPFLKELKHLKQTKIFADIHISKMAVFLKQVQQIGMLTSDYSYIFTTLDFQTLDLEDYKYSSANVTGFRMVDPRKQDIQDLISDWERDEMRYNRIVSIPVEKVDIETALLYDSVYLFAKGLSDLDNSQMIDFKPLSCDGSETWPHGFSLINFANLVEIEGITGNIKLDNQGFRTHFQLDVVSLAEEGLHTIGYWTPLRNYTQSDALVLLPTVPTLSKAPPKSEFQQIADGLVNQTLVLSTIINEPYCMRKKSVEQKYGNDQYEGYVIDLINNIAKKYSFNVDIHLTEDGKHGALDPATGEWNGIIRDLLDNKADIGAIDLSINPDRNAAVDFTMPFMNVGITILYVKPKKQSPDFFSFMAPFSNDVWFYMAAGYVGVSLVVYICGKLSPYEWDNPYPCIQNPEELENQFSMLNSFWFTIGSIMQQGSEIAPKAVSTRTAAAVWWCFTLIIVSSYTANLATFLIVETTTTPVNHVSDLIKPELQGKIKYGAVGSGSTFTFFGKSNNSVYQEIHRNMKQWDMPGSGNEGVQRVEEENGGFAFFMESSSVDYQKERKCKLTDVGGTLDTKGLGIALRPGSNYTALFNAAILEMQENAELTKLKTKWWKERDGGGQCAESEGGGAAEPLGLANVGGVFAVLVLGVAIAFVIAIGELLWVTWHTAKEEGTSFIDDLKTELRFIMKFKGSSKPARRKKDDSVEEEKIQPLREYQPKYAFVEK